jgi:OmpA-OmpF porin, OOP family
MNSKALLPILGLLGLAVLWGWYYNNNTACCANNPEGIAAGKNTLPYYFNGANDKIVDTSLSFTNYQDSIKRGYGAGDTILVTGYYYNTEDSAVGLERANQLKNLIASRYGSGPYKLLAQKQGSDVAAGDFLGADVGFLKYTPPANSNVATSVMSSDGTLILYFPTGSTVENFDPNTETNLKNVIEASKQAGKALEVVGHTDNKGNAAKNITLSKGRADKVKSILVARGANAAIISTNGLGQNQPIETNDTDAGRAKNRRVEVKVVNAASK